MLLNSFPKEFEFIKQMHHRDRSFNLDQMKQTAINFHIDDLSRKSSAPPISGRGAAMAAASSSDQCHHCKASGHFKRDCPKLAQKNRSNRGKKGKKSKGGDHSPKWCSYHMAATHSDAQCHKQKELQHLTANLAPLWSSEQRFANIGSALLVQTPQPEPQPEPKTFGFSFSAVGASLVEATASTSTSASAATESAGKPAVPTTPALQHGSTPPESPPPNRGIPEGAFGAFVATTPALSAASFHSDETVLTMMVDSGATHSFVDPFLTPG